MKLLHLSLILLALGVACERADTSATAPAPADASEQVASARLERSSEGELTAARLYDQEELWPYHVKLTAAWPPWDGGRTVAAGTPGVLIRLEDAEVARIDFSAGGIQRVPIGRTNIVEQALAIRAGARTKAGANYVVAIGPRLIDGNAAVPTNLALAATNDATGFLSVFADPGSAVFVDLARELSPVEGLHGVQTVLFPQGEHADFEVLAWLQDADWPVSFVMSRLAEPYTKTLVSEDISGPRLALTSREGRVLFEQAWAPGAIEALVQEIEATLGATDVASMSARGTE